MSRLARLYEWIYTRIGGKPWTEIIREEQRGAPLLFILIFLGFGILVAKLAGRYWWQILVGFLLGVLCGHFWW